MINLTVTDVRPYPADTGFLIDDGKTAILYDTGFAFTGEILADNVKKALGDRKLDYIFLTHSHYDHALGTPYVQKYYPEAKVVAGTYATTIFGKPTARAKMRELDRKFAETCGVLEYEDLIDELHIDIAVDEGDKVTCGDMVFTAINLPGHTKCSVGFYLEENKLLLATETLGVYFENKTYLPICLVGYQMMMDSYEKAKALEIESLLIPHYGLLEKDEAKNYLVESQQAAADTAEKFKSILQNGGTEDDAVTYFKDLIYKGKVKETYPIDAFNLNTRIMVELIKKELM